MLRIWSWFAHIYLHVMNGVRIPRSNDIQTCLWVNGTQDSINGVKLYDTMTCALTPIVIQRINNTCSNECECMFCSIFGCKETLI
jgi:hypothetical protein